MPVVNPLRAFLLSILAPITAACSPLTLLDAFVPESGYERVEGMPYGLAGRQNLDIYRPAGAHHSAPVIVFMYGGSWKSGSRKDYRFVGQTLASLGYVAVVPDYRLFPEVRFPAFVQDAAKAVAWVHREIAIYNGNPDKIVLAGHSAGAHIAALLALDPSYLREAGVAMSVIAGLIGLAGPYGFDPLEYSSIRPIFEKTRDVDAARPITFAHAGAPPTLLLHGAEDWTVAERNSAEMARRLKSEGVSVRYVPLDSVGHSGILLALSSPFRRLAPVVEQIVEFMDFIDRRRSPVQEAPYAALRHIHLARLCVRQHTHNRKSAHGHELM